jgi:hypothetical protein
MAMRREQDDDHKIKLNVGGKQFVTNRTTLARAGRESMLGAMISHDWAPEKPDSHEYFIDRNPAYFPLLLDLLRTSELHIPPHMSEKALYREAIYYGLMDRVHMAKWSRSLDGNQVRHAASIRGRATGDATAIRAAQDGGCCVAHGSMVHVYDWTMEELHPLNLDYYLVNDVGFLDTQRLVVCTCTSVDKPGHGGMASFNTRTGKLQHRFQVCSQGGQHKNFTAGALASSRDGHVYASCRGLSAEYGVGIWDQTTGHQVDFVYDWPLGDAGKLQWLPESNLLLAATLYPRSDHAHINLMDFREKGGVVLSWTDCHLLDDKVVVDTVAMDDCITVSVVNQYDNLGFLDMRSMNHVKWCHRNRPGKMVSQSFEEEEKWYSKLAACGTQLFSTKNKSVHVFCGPDWVLTSQVENKRGACGGAISDISVGGNRLFVLYNEEDVFDVWETPASLNTGVYQEDE